MIVTRQLKKINPRSVRDIKVLLGKKIMHSASKTAEPKAAKAVFLMKDALFITTVNAAAQRCFYFAEEPLGLRAFQRSLDYDVKFQHRL